MTVLMAFAVFVQYPRERERRVTEALKTLASAVELRFPRYRGGTETCVQWSLELGRHAGLGRRQLKRLEWAAWAQDLGLCSIPYGQLNERPIETWSKLEHTVYREHPESGAAMLELVPMLRELAPIVRHHHGHALDDEEDPRESSSIESRILCLVNGYLWHRQELGEGIARDHLIEQKGRLYDASLVDVLLEMTHGKSTDPQED